MKTGSSWGSAFTTEKGHNSLLAALVGLIEKQSPLVRSGSLTAPLLIDSRTTVELYFFTPHENTGSLCAIGVLFNNPASKRTTILLAKVKRGWTNHQYHKIFKTKSTCRISEQSNLFILPHCDKQGGLMNQRLIPNDIEAFEGQKFTIVRTWDAKKSLFWQIASYTRSERCIKR